jgi:hypothetical protein
MMLYVQMFNEMFGDPNDGGDPNSFDNDDDEEEEGVAYLTPSADSPKDKCRPHATITSIKDDDSSTTVVCSNLFPPAGYDPQNERPQTATAQLSSLFGSVGKAASKGLNINSNLRSLSIQTSTGLNLAVENIGAQAGQRRPHSMRSSQSMMASITNTTSGIMAKMGTKRRTASLDKMGIPGIPEEELGTTCSTVLTEDQLLEDSARDSGRSGISVLDVTDHVSQENSSCNADSMDLPAAEDEDHHSVLVFPASGEL